MVNPTKIDFPLTSPFHRTIYDPPTLVRNPPSPPLPISTAVPPQRRHLKCVRLILELPLFFLTCSRTREGVEGETACLGRPRLVLLATLPVEGPESFCGNGWFAASTNAR